MTDITATLWFLLLSTVSTADVFYFNEEMDGFFAQFRENMRQAKNDQFPIPNIRAAFTKRLLFLNLHGEVNGTSGTVSDLTTIKRTNNVTIVTAKEYYVFRVEFGLEDLKVRYNYQARFLGVVFHGELDLGIEKNSIYIEVLVNVTGNRCSGDVLTVRSLRFAVLDGISVRVTGFSLVNPLMSYWLTRSFRDVSSDVTGAIEEALRVFLKQNIKQFDFCKFGNVPENIPFDDMDSSDDITTNCSGGINVTLKDINAVLE